MRLCVRIGAIMKVAAITAVAVMLAVPASAGLPGTFQVSYAGQLGGTEIRNLVAYDGKLFAANGYWEDTAGAASPGPQILVLDRTGGAWRVDHQFNDRMPNGRPRHIAVSTLNVVTFRTDARGQALPAPVSLLLASTWDVTGRQMVYVRDETGAWSGTMLAQDRPSGKFLPQIRGFSLHHDQQTGADLAFAGDTDGIYAGAFDQTAPGHIRWNTTPELDAHGISADAFPGLEHRLRISSFAEADGRFYAAVGQEIWTRDDGPTPRWRLIYTNPKPRQSETGLRGLTSVTEHGKTFLLAGVDGYGCRIVRVDPVTGAETTDLNVAGMLNTAWGTRVSFVIAGYNDMPRYGDDLLIGLEAFIPPASPRPPGHHVLDVVHGIEGGGWFLVRHQGGRYELHQVTARFPRLDNDLVSVRTFVVSPFHDEPGVFYVGGYDANYTPAHDTAWIARFVPAR